MTGTRLANYILKVKSLSLVLLKPRETEKQTADFETKEEEGKEDGRN